MAKRWKTADDGFRHIHVPRKSVHLDSPILPLAEKKTVEYVSYSDGTDVRAKTATAQTTV